MQVEYKWDFRHSKVLHEYLVALDNQGIEYFILRNYEGLPENNNSKDIDLIIKPGKYKNAAKVLVDVLKNNKVTNYYFVKFERANCWIGIDVDNDFYIHIDLIEGYLNKGFEIFDFEKLYENTIQYKNYRVLNDHYDAVMLLLYKVIGVGELKEKYRDKISAIYKDDSQSIKNILNTIFNLEMTEEICTHIGKGDFEWIVSQSKTLSRKSKNLALIRRPLYTLKNICEFLLEKFERIVICPKKMRRMIAVEAPDGTGKTTFIDLLTVKLAECFVTDISKMHVYHFRPTLFPNLGELGEKAGVIEQDKDFENPHRGKKTGILSSLIRISYYTLDYMIGGFICLRKDSKFDKFTIFDRYSYDFLVDPLRTKINLPYNIRKFFCSLTPKPQITFVLNADSKTIYERKQELTIDEIDRQLVEFQKLENVSRGYKMLDATKTPDEIVKVALHTILDAYTHKVDDH